jgi:hypothetical protein
MRSLWKKRERSPNKRWWRIPFQEAALWHVLPRKNSEFRGSTAGTRVTCRPREESVSQRATRVEERRPNRSAATETCCRAQTSSPRARKDKAPSSATLIIAYAHSQRRTTVSKSWAFSRGRAVNHSSVTLRHSAAGRAFGRLEKTTPPPRSPFSITPKPPVSRGAALGALAPVCYCPWRQVIEWGRAAPAARARPGPKPGDPPLEKIRTARHGGKGRFLDALRRRPLYSPDSHVASDRKGSCRWNSNRSTSTCSAARN